MPAAYCPPSDAPGWAYQRCDYVRYGAAMLTASIYAWAWSPVLLVPRPTALVFWGALTLVGGTFAGAGVAAVRTHADYFYAGSMFRSAALAAIAFCGISGDWSLPRVFGPWLICASHGAFFVLLAYGLAGVALQIRSLIAQRENQPPQATEPAPNTERQPEPVLHEFPIVEWQAAQIEALRRQNAVLTTERDSARAQGQQASNGEIARLRAEVSELKTEKAAIARSRDRFQTNGRQVLHERQKMEALLLAPGVEAALTKAIHSDVGRMHASDEEIRIRDAAFIQLRETYRQLKQRRR